MLNYSVGIRAIKAINRLAIITLGDLLQKTEDDLLDVHGFGLTSLHHVTEMLAQHPEGPFHLREEGKEIISQSEADRRLKKKEIIPPTDSELSNLLERTRLLEGEIQQLEQTGLPAKSEVRHQGSPSQLFLSDAERVAVAIEAMMGIFAVETMLKIGRESVLFYLERERPELFVSETPALHFHQILFERATALSQPVRIVWMHEGIPDLSDPEIQVLTDLVADNRFVSLLIHVPGTGRSEARGFETSFQKEVMSRRIKAGNTFGGVNVRVETAAGAPLEFVNSGLSRSLVYGTDAAELNRIHSNLPAAAKSDILVVHADQTVSGDPLKEATSLLAAIVEIFSPNPMPQTVVHAGDLLSAHLDLMQQVRELFSQSA
jgi:hypothetical protein